MFLKPKKVHIEKRFFKRSPIEIPNQEIDRLNQQIIKGVKQKELEQEKALNNAKFPRIKY